MIATFGVGGCVDGDAGVAGMLGPFAITSSSTLSLYAVLREKPSIPLKETRDIRVDSE